MLRAYNSFHFNSELNAKKRAGQNATAFPTIAVTAIAAGMKAPMISHVDMPVNAHESKVIAHTDVGAQSRAVEVDVNEEMKMAPMDEEMKMAPMDKHMEMLKSFTHPFFQRAPSMFHPFDYPAFSWMAFPSIFTPSRCPFFCASIDPFFTPSFTPSFTHSFGNSFEPFFNFPRIETTAFNANIPETMKGTSYDMSNEEDRSAAQEKCKELGLTVPSTKTKSIVIGVENGTAFVREEGENFEATQLRHEEKSDDKKSLVSIQKSYSYSSGATNKDSSSVGSSNEGADSSIKAVELSTADEFSVGEGRLNEGSSNDSSGEEDRPVNGAAAENSSAEFDNTEENDEAADEGDASFNH